jgi:ketosteroid isomerase-like protein
MIESKLYPQVSFQKDGELVRAFGRRRLIFLVTADRWKIIHEHGTPKACFGQ